MNIGVLIRKGPQSWQIIQQQGGKGEIYLSGVYILPENAQTGEVYAKVVLEETYESVTKWQKAKALEDNKWEINLKDIPAGGLYRIETCLKTELDQRIEWARRGDMIHHVGIGDLYVIAGQSNSAGYGKGPVFDPPELGIHLFKNNGNWDLASHPFNDSTHTRHSVNSEGANPGHSPYLSFARKLKKELGYPIGLIQTALGGSPLSAWNPKEEGHLYRNMLESIQSTTEQIAGILWYQGCSDTYELEKANTYLERFKQLVESIRKDLMNEEIPFLTVQLNRVVNDISSDEIAEQQSDEGWSKVREAQRQAAMSIEGVYIIPAIDSTLSDAIHNSSQSNLIIGERLARLALKNIYGKMIMGDAPNISKLNSIGEKKIELIFNHVNERLDVFEVGCLETPFEVVDEKGQAKINGYSIEGNKIILRLDRELGEEAYVSCGKGRNPKGYIPRDIEGEMPVLLFNKLKINFLK